MTRWASFTLTAAATFVAALLTATIMVFAAWATVGLPGSDEGHIDQIVVEAPHSHTDPRYIVIELLGLTFTEQEYHDRVRGQIERDGYTTICINHLGTLAQNARYLSVNSARQNLVYVTECAAAEFEAAPDGDALMAATL